MVSRLKNLPFLHRKSYIANLTLLNLICKEVCIENTRNVSPLSSSGEKSKGFKWTSYQTISVTLSATLTLFGFILGVVTFCWNRAQKNKERRQGKMRQKNELVKKALALYFKLMRRPISIVTEMATNKTKELKKFKSNFCAFCVLLCDLKEYMRLKLSRNSDLRDEDDDFKPRITEQGKEIFCKAYIRNLHDDMNDVTELLLLISKAIVEFSDKEQQEQKTFSGKLCSETVGDHHGEIEEFKDIGMKIFFDNLYEFWINYYLKVYGSVDKVRSNADSDGTDGLQKETPEFTSEDNYSLFLCERIKIVIEYFDINPQLQLQDKIKYTEHILDTCSTVSAATSLQCNRVRTPASAEASDSTPLMNETDF